MHHKDLTENLRVCNSCNYHFRISAEERINLLFSNGDFKEIELDTITDDPLNFVDKKKYKDRLKEYRRNTKRNDAFILLDSKLVNKEIISGFMNFEFMGGSMGRAVGAAIVKGAKIAVEKKIPFLIFTASGGARMQEGIISLMQMPRTVAAVELLHKNSIPYIVCLLYTSPSPRDRG